VTGCDVEAGRYRDAVRLMVGAVDGLTHHTRTFFYKLMLHGRACPRCGGVELLMVREGRYRCRDCGQAGDPTLKFQSCPTCDGQLALVHRRYRCRDCGEVVVSMFLFDGVVYDADYFRHRMAESRQRRADQQRAENENQAARAWQRTPA
jgi:Zn finger protein HypA/HybF involved in hydrogenase expression